MNSCCTVPATKLNVAVPATRPARWPFASLQKIIHTAGFTAVDLTHIFFIDPERPAESAPHRTHCDTR